MTVIRSSQILMKTSRNVNVQNVQSIINVKDNDEHLFCTRGISKCDFNKTGCNCPTCPVWIKYELISLFYCEKGAEKKD